MPTLLRTLYNRKQFFFKIVVISDFEMVESEYFFKNLDKCLYYALQLLSKYPNNRYLHSTIAKCLYEMHQAQKQHKLNKYVEHTAPHHTETYKALLTFIHNLRLTEIAKIGYHYAAKQETACLDKEDFLFAYCYFSHILDIPDKKQELSTLYKTKFPDGSYLPMLQSLNEE